METKITSQLVERLKSEDISALGELYEILSKKIYNRCFFILKDQDLAEDATQEVFLKAFSQIKSLKQDLKIGGWLNRMAYNYCIDLIRKNQKEIDKTNQVLDRDELTSFIEEIDEINNSEHYKAILKQELAQLSESERLVIILYYWEGNSISEIAAQMALGESAVKMKLSRTRSKLKERMEGHGMDHAVQLSVLLLLNLI